ncbi:hypothetical protein NQ314_001343 [Rhamnusium bicolor]|uniref:CRAL-TRIO domain-containing protein n=1 Tax=Rhamnusium bicolor TaxID=1586634 RepID=A0AAV8ZUJ0_9CUCU|nr:hypothetical protein NQ314_001343 [Rhamnusium bicolor]
MTTTENILPSRLRDKNSNNEITRSLIEKQKAHIMQELFKIADRELRENEIVRKQCLAHLREWIKQNVDIENCITGKFDLKKYSGTDMSRAHAITYETLIADQENQILGVNHVADFDSITPAFQSFPMRHKEINFINLPAPVKYIYDIVKQTFSQKLKDRFVIHDSKEKLLNRVDKLCLPFEFGGEMPAKEMIQMWKEELNAKRERLLSFDSINLLSDRGIIRTRNITAHDNTGTESLPGSFRKLELD